MFFMETENEVFRISRKRTLLELAVLAVSGAGMSLAYPPASIGFFAWVCTIPLIALCAKRSWRRAFWYGLVWGYFWHVTGTFFLREISPFIPFVFAVVLGLFNAVFALAVPLLFKVLLYPADIRKADFDIREKFYRYPVSGELIAVFMLAAWWVLLEYIRSHIFTGFPWNLLGISQWKSFSLIQICEYTGVYGVSFLVILTGIAGYFALHGFRFSLPEGKYKRPFPLIIAVILVIAANAAGLQLVKRCSGELRPVAVGVVQPHLSQRRAGTQGQSQEALDVCTRLTGELIRKDKTEISWKQEDGQENDRANMLSDFQKARYPLNLIVWPESAVPRTYYNHGDYENIVAQTKRAAGTNPLAMRQLIALQEQKPFEAVYRETVRGMMAEVPDVPFLIGTLTFEPSGKIYNSALLLKHAKQVTGKKWQYNYDTADVYSKVHIVPFGEFVPMADKFPVLDEWVGLGRSLSPGPAFRPVSVQNGIDAGIMICYEDVFPYTARELARNKANFLLVITNDAWYPESSEPEQHFVNALFRTIETRLPMVRAGNSDYSVLIDPYGRVADSVFKHFANDGSVTFQPERKGSGAEKFIVPVPLQPQLTFYTRYGDWFVGVCLMVLLTGIFYTVSKQIRYAGILLKPLEEKQRQIRQSYIDFENMEKKKSRTLAEERRAEKEEKKKRDPVT